EHGGILICYRQAQSGPALHQMPDFVRPPPGGLFLWPSRNISMVNNRDKSGQSGETDTRAS
ncbi:hypothetical protein, partial [Paracoccus versutus]